MKEEQKMKMKKVKQRKKKPMKIQTTNGKPNRTTK